eukprot:178293-Prorocentrum_minimum.AAC.1
MSTHRRNCPQIFRESRILQWRSGLPRAQRPRYLQMRAALARPAGCGGGAARVARAFGSARGVPRGVPLLGGGGAPPKWGALLAAQARCACTPPLPPLLL